LVKGPFINDKKNVSRFKRAHKKTSVKKGSVYAKVKHNLIFEEFFKNFVKKEKKIMKQMCIKKISLVE